jgi:hypothetical protein
LRGAPAFLEFEIVFFAAPEPLFESLRFALNFVDFFVEQLFVTAGHEPVVVFVEQGVDALLEFLGLQCAIPLWI